MMNKSNITERLTLSLIDDDGYKHVARQTYTASPWQRVKKFLGFNTCYCDDLIVDTGLARIAYLISEDFDYLSVGTGTTAPTNTDTQLETETLTRAAATKSLQTNFYTNDTVLFSGTFSSAYEVTLTEAGIHRLATSTGDTMLARETFYGLTKPAGIDLGVDWEVIVMR